MNMTMPDLSSAERLHGDGSGEPYRSATLGTPCEQAGECAPDAAVEVTEPQSEVAQVTNEEIERVMQDFAVMGIPQRYETKLRELLDVAEVERQVPLFVWDAGPAGRAILRESGLRIEGTLDPVPLGTLANHMMPAILLREASRPKPITEDEDGCPISAAGETLWRALTGDDTEALQAASDVMLDLVNTVWEGGEDDVDLLEADKEPEPTGEYPKDMSDADIAALEAEIAHAKRPNGVLDRAFTRVAATGTAMIRLSVAPEGTDDVAMELVEDYDAAVDVASVAEREHDEALWVHAKAQARREGAAIIERGQAGVLAVRSPQTHRIARVDGWPGLPLYQVLELSDA